MSSRTLQRNLALAAVTSFVLGASSVQCGSSTSHTFSGTGTSNGGSASTASSMMSAMGGSSSTLSGGMGGEIGFDVQVADYSAEQIYGDDPPPMTCDGGGKPPPPPGGSPTCPDDKNLPGCICPAAGMKAACWEGLRKDRGIGDCKDGVTTCMMNSESTLAWGPCVGETLPVQGATGKTACECFSTGHWQIDNLDPCFLTSTDGMGNMTTVAFASTQGNPVTCPFDATSGTPTVPTGPGSTDSLNVDCAGTYALCYTIKAGDPKSPQASDCVVAQSCVTADYATAGQVQVLPPLPGWSSTPSMAACVQQFLTTGGYGQMSVNGQSNECELVVKVFQTVPYCPPSCNGSDAGICGTCTNGGSGNF